MNEIISVGLDIGGANVKINAIVMTDSGEFRLIHYFNRQMLVDNFDHVLNTFKNDFKVNFDVVGVTTTGEYGIIFPRLKDGIIFFKEKISNFFKQPTYWMNLSGDMIKLGELNDPYDVVASNWVATSLFVGEYICRDCILVDSGSTTTDIIPISKGRPVNKSRFDYERLASGNLVYTGGINTHVGCITNKLILNEVETNLSSEYFATAGDIHYILGHINSLTYRNYLGRFPGYSNPDECYTRLAHMICADDKLISRETILDMAKQVYEKQLNQISESIKRVYLESRAYYDKKPAIVTTGMCSDFLVKPAAKKAGFVEIISVGEKMGTDISITTPSFAVAVLAGKKFLNI